ncbi:hypothetical protein IQ07DRAFT_595756 [Pyrenochaeta sp. DS3sAY3a]|nr:hypothetical protein IQ07DRAFT_595756 [Pyrenochaeta sp. DS3sAY3a]
MRRPDRGSSHESPLLAWCVKATAAIAGATIQHRLTIGGHSGHSLGRSSEQAIETILFVTDDIRTLIDGWTRRMQRATILGNNLLSFTAVKELAGLNSSRRHLSTRRSNKQ